MTRKEEIEKASEEYYNEVKYLSDLSAFPIAAFKAGAEWADKTMIDRVCEWLQNNLIKEMSIISSGVLNINTSNAIKELRKAMEE